MKHVFVETNFLIEVARPFQGSAAQKLLERAKRGELWFCNLNKRDFDPTNQPKLAAEYQASSLTFLTSFDVPS